MPLPPAQHAVFIRKALEQLNKVTADAVKDGLEVEFSVCDVAEEPDKGNLSLIEVKISKLL